MSERRVLFACDLDSQIFGALPLALGFRARGWRASFLVDAGRGPTDGVLERVAGRFEMAERSLGALAAEDDAFAYDAIGVFATGSRVALFRHTAALAAEVRGGPRPALFCGFNGLVLGRFEEGVAWRLGFDQICLNGPRDLDALKAFVATSDFAAQPVVTTGISRNPDVPLPPLKPAPRPGDRKLFVFAEQVAVPSDPRRRAELVDALARLAERSPGWDVTVKPRVRPQEQTFFDQTRHVERLVEKMKRRPANFHVSYAALDDLLARADLFGTISSTALFDALDQGVPSLLASDFGIRNAHGSHVTLGSGVATRIADLGSLDDVPRRAPEPSWLARAGYGPPYSPDALIDRLEAFDPAAPLPPALYSFEEAARGATPSADRAEEVLAARRAVLTALDGRGHDSPSTALARLGKAIGASDRQRAIDEAWRTCEGRTARLARRLGFYAPYKAIRSKMLGEFPK